MPRSVSSRACGRCGDIWTPWDPSVKTTLCLACREADALVHVYRKREKWSKAVRKRAAGLCESCGRTETEAGAHHHAHHVKPRHEGGKNTLANGKLLCVECHGDIHGATVGRVAYRLRDEDVERIAQRVAELVLESSFSEPT